MKRLPRMALLALVATIAATMLLPAQEASALSPPYGTCMPEYPQYACNTPVSSLSYFKGWASIPRYCGGAPPGPGMDGPVDAWRWTSYGWRAAKVERGRVYVWPYATGWSWIWTSATGWLAIQDHKLVVNSYCPPGLP